MPDSTVRDVLGSKPRPDQHLGSLTKWEESAFICKWLEFLVFSDKDVSQPFTINNVGRLKNHEGRNEPCLWPSLVLTLGHLLFL